MIYHEKMTIINVDGQPSDTTETTGMEQTQEEQVDPSTLNNVSSDFYEQVLEAQETGNDLQTLSFAGIFFIAMLLMGLFLYLIIKNNITRHF